MKHTKFLIYIVALLCLNVMARAAEPQHVTWAELAPPPVKYENPFKALSSEQMDGLRQLLILRLQATRDNGTSSEQAAALQAELEESGLDVDWLFAKRKEIMQIRLTAATAVNEQLLGKLVRLPGYVLPLEVKDYKAVEFLLVPTVGACIHTPPPPANQLVHVRYPQGLEVKGMYQPVWIQGHLGQQQSVQSVRYVDGSARIEVSYFMQPIRIEPYGQ